MSNKTKINFILSTFIILWAVMGYFISKEEKKHSEKQPTFYKKEYKFPKPKDWNTENLTSDKRRFYEQLNSAE